MEIKQEVVKQIQGSIELKKWLQGEAKTLISIASRISTAVRNGNQIFLFGNGGSAADAQHMASELAGKFYRDRDPIPATALSTNTSSITAIGNDYGFDEIFARQVSGLVKKGDIVIGISTSGKSPNVIKGIKTAKKLEAVTIVLTGKEAKLASLADIALCIPSKDTPRIQEAHITAGHIICYLVEAALFEKKSK